MSNNLEPPDSTPLPPPNSILFYLSEHKALICLHPDCRYALRPGKASDHLFFIHGIPADLRKPYEEYEKDLDVSGPGTMQLPEHGDPPVRGLRLRDGRVCRL